MLLEDSAALGGLAIAAIGLACAQAFQLPVLDGVASVLIGVLLASVAAFLASECKGLLLGEAANPAVTAELRAIAESGAGVRGVNEVLTMHFSPQDVLAAISLDFDDAQTAGKVEHTVSDVERRIKAALPQVRRIFIEVQSRGSHLRAQRETAPRKETEA